MSDVKAYEIFIISILIFAVLGLIDFIYVIIKFFIDHVRIV